jgi:mRNA interferase MazF
VKRGTRWDTSNCRETVRVGTADGLKKESSIHCDELVSLQKSALTHYVGSLTAAALRELNGALAISLGLE